MWSCWNQKCFCWIVSSFVSNCEFCFLFRFVSFRFSTSLGGARNVPLFDDEARALVGTDFKRKGRYEVRGFPSGFCEHDSEEQLKKYCKTSEYKEYKKHKKKNILDKALFCNWSITCSIAPHAWTWKILFLGVEMFELEVRVKIVWYLFISLKRILCKKTDCNVEACWNSVLSVLWHWTLQAIRRGLQLAGPNFANFLDAVQELCRIPDSPNHGAWYRYSQEYGAKPGSRFLVYCAFLRVDTKQQRIWMFTLLSHTI